MAPLYHIDVMTKAGVGGAAATPLKTLLSSTANLFWKHGAVVAEMRSWGKLQLAYRCVARCAAARKNSPRAAVLTSTDAACRIRRGGQNHYYANYVTLQVYCSPKALQEAEAAFRTNDHVLRYMTIKQKQVPSLDKETQRWFEAVLRWRELAFEKALEKRQP